MIDWKILLEYSDRRLLYLNTNYVKSLHKIFNVVTRVLRK